jgi:hypothetical protein
MYLNCDFDPDLHASLRGRNFRGGANLKRHCEDSEILYQCTWREHMRRSWLWGDDKSTVRVKVRVKVK